MLAGSFKFGQQIQDGKIEKLMVGGIVFQKHNVLLLILFINDLIVLYLLLGLSVSECL